MVGNVRFCLRSDLPASAYGTCEVEELHGVRAAPPSGCDILLVAKRRMADKSPIHIKCVMTAGRAAALRAAFEQPSGVASHRAIGEKVQKNIASLAPRCQKQGIISDDGASYLLSWSQGEWGRKARPTSYAVLGHRHASPLDVVMPSGLSAWKAPSRLKHVDLRTQHRCGSEAGTSSESEEEPGAIDLE